MADLVNCCNGNAAGDLTQQIVTAIDDITANAEKIRKFTNGGVTETVSLGGIQTNTLRKLVYDATNNLNGYVTQAANSAAQAANSKNATAVSAASAAASAASADKNAGICLLSAASAAVSASDASISAAKAKFYADKLDGIDAVIEAHSLAIAVNAQGISDLSWTPWGIASTACRESRSAIVQAMHDYRTWLRDNAQDEAIADNRLSIARDEQGLADLAWTPWGTAVTAVRQSVSAIRQAIAIYSDWSEADENHASTLWSESIIAVRQSVSAIRQAVEIGKLYRLVGTLTSGGGSGLIFVPNN